MKLLIEAAVMFGSIRPFLEALRVEPESVPFGLSRPPPTRIFPDAPDLPSCIRHTT